MPDQDQRRKLLRALEYRQVFDDRLERIERQTSFDSDYEVETAQNVELWDLPEADLMPVGRNARYSPTPVRTVRNALSRCGVRHEEVTFVDVGSGKGRVLLLAAELPFRRIVGVEASETLCGIAASNVRKAAENRDGFDRIEIVHADATSYDIPEDGGLFYFYEPFSVEVALTFLGMVEDSIRHHPRRVVLCFTGRGQPDGAEDRAGEAPVAAAAAEIRDGWRLVEVVPSPDAEFYDSFLYEYADTAHLPGDGM